MAKQEKTKKMIGWWRSIITYRDPITKEETKTITKWRKNLIVDTAYVLQSALFKGEAGYSGLQYMAFGDGSAGWDPIPPAPSPSDTTLFSEIFRYQLQASDFDYLDAGLIVVPGPEPRLQVTGVLDYGDAVGSYIREFGLFGGTATAVPNSGVMVDVIRAERFMKTGSIRLERQIVLGMGLA